MRNDAIFVLISRDGRGENVSPSMNAHHTHTHTRYIDKENTFSVATTDNFPFHVVTHFPGTFSFMKKHTEEKWFFFCAVRFSARNHRQQQSHKFLPWWFNLKRHAIENEENESLRGVRTESKSERKRETKSFIDDPEMNKKSIIADNFNHVDVSFYSIANKFTTNKSTVNIWIRSEIMHF